MKAFFARVANFFHAWTEASAQRARDQERDRLAAELGELFLDKAYNAAREPLIMQRFAELDQENLRAEMAATRSRARTTYNEHGIPLDAVRQPRTQAPEGGPGNFVFSSGLKEAVPADLSERRWAEVVQMPYPANEAEMVAAFRKQHPEIYAAWERAARAGAANVVVTHLDGKQTSYPA